jgi:hypothetical protein
VQRAKSIWIAISKIYIVEHPLDWPVGHAVSRSVYSARDEAVSKLPWATSNVYHGPGHRPVYIQRYHQLRREKFKPVVKMRIVYGLAWGPLLMCRDKPTVCALYTSPFRFSGDCWPISYLVDTTIKTIAPLADRIASRQSHLYVAASIHSARVRIRPNTVIPESFVRRRLQRQQYRGHLYYVCQVVSLDHQVVISLIAPWISNKMYTDHRPLFQYQCLLSGRTMAVINETQ